MKFYRYKCKTDKAFRRVQQYLVSNKIPIVLQGTERDSKARVFEFWSEEKLNTKEQNVDIEIIRDSPTAGKTKFYRVVIDG